MLKKITNRHNKKEKIFSLCICLLAIILLFIFIPSLLLNNNSKVKKSKKIKVSTSKIALIKKDNSSKTKPSTPNSEVKSNNTGEDTNNTNQSIPNYGVKTEDAFIEDGKKTAYLTFDDGPSTTVTPKILDTLKNYNVHATFFLLGDMIQKNPGSDAIVKRTFDEGNSIGNHTYYHNLSLIYPNNILSINEFISEVDKTSNILKGILGQAFSTRVVRLPGGRMSRVHYKDPNLTELDNVLKQKNMVSIDWNAYDHDSEKVKEFAPQLITHVKNEASNHNKVVVLMHDTYSKEETAKALPAIIEYFKSAGYEFKTLY